jgi:GT2 family glycosyltransferase
VPHADSSNTLLLTAVHYNDSEQVAAYAQHVCALPKPDGWRVAVAIADNSRSWNAANVLPEGACVYVAPQNLGYLSGCAFALSQWQEEHGILPAWTAVANTDLQFANSFFVGFLSRSLPEDTGMVGPRTHLPDGTLQNPFMRARPGRLRMFYNTMTYRTLPLMSLMEAAYRAKRSVRKLRKPAATTLQGSLASPKAERIYAAHGSAMFLRRAFFDRGGTLEYRGFMYGEEIHLAEQCRRLGLGVYWLPDLDVLHEAHTSTSRVARMRRRQWLHESARIAWEDYFCRG